jgi:hypothetical protein
MENNSSSKSICGSEDECNPRHIAITRLLIIMRLRLRYAGLMKAPSKRLFWKVNKITAQVYCVFS